jgi:AbiJ N-terminal domain 3/Abortive infection C-terminus
LDIERDPAKMKAQLRHLVADALYPTKAYNLPAVCERYGLESGSSEEAFSSKTRYVTSRLERMSDEQVLGVARSIAKDFPDDKLRAAVELLDTEGHLVSDITRHHLAEALDEFSLAGKRDLLDLLRKFWPAIDREPSVHDAFDRLTDDIERHVLRNDDWSNAELLGRVGFLTCSQTKLFEFLEDVLHPIRRDSTDQEEIVAKLNPILRRDGYFLAPSGRVSGYPVYRVPETTATGIQPADNLISEMLRSFDESGVHHAWQKALDRRVSDPEGAITAAKTLLETVCKHIIDDAGGAYGDNDDLPKLYAGAAEHLNLAPGQHTETVFKSILGNCQSVVGNLAALRNRLGDAHGQGRRPVKPLPRHAELAVNLAGSMAMFLVSTWVQQQRPVKE